MFWNKKKPKIKIETFNSKMWKFINKLDNNIISNSEVWCSDRLKKDAYILREMLLNNNITYYTAEKMFNNMEKQFQNEYDKNMNSELLRLKKEYFSLPICHLVKRNFKN